MSQNKYPTDPTVVVAIIGLGKRDEMLVRQAKGEGLDGEPVNYSSLNQPDGRHFKLSAYPVVVSSLKVILKTRNRTSLEDNSNLDVLSTDMYFQDETYGYIVLKHPLKAGEQLRVQYIATFDENNPRLFDKDQLATLYQYYGVPSITNTVSLGARIAFTSGTQYVLATLGESLDVDPVWDRAFAALENESPYYVVPLPPQSIDLTGQPIPEPVYSPYSMIAQRASQFVDKMSSAAYRSECVLVLGETNSFTQADAKISYGSAERVLFASPMETQCALIQGQYQTFDGRFLAPVLAGLLASVGITETAMGKTETAVIVANKFKKSSVELQELTNNGISYFVPSAGGAKIPRPITTSQSNNPVLQEPSVLRIRDYIAYTLRNILEVRFVGKVIVANLEGDILKAVVNFCKAQIAANLLTDAKNFKVVQDNIELRQMDISLDIQPVFPLVYINVSFRVMLL